MEGGFMLIVIVTQARVLIGFWKRKIISPLIPSVWIQQSSLYMVPGT